MPPNLTAGDLALCICDKGYSVESVGWELTNDLYLL